AAVSPAISDLPFVPGDRVSAFAAPRSVVITRAAAARLFGSDNPIGKTLLVGNSVDATVTGLIDAIPEPSHLGRSASALAMDMFASRDVYDALRAPSPIPAAQAAQFGWFQIGTVVYLYLPPSGGLSPDALRSQLGDFVARHVPA